jgi:hypothetical protein
LVIVFRLAKLERFELMGSEVKAEEILKKVRSWTFKNWKKGQSDYKKPENTVQRCVLAEKPLNRRN